MKSVESLRWGRILLGGFLAELLLVLVVIPLRALGGGEGAVTVLAVGGSFVAVAVIAWWLCRPLGRPVVQGALIGVCAAAIYLALQVGAQVFAPAPPEVPAIYYVAHVLKIAGGAAGGWLAVRLRS